MAIEQDIAAVLGDPHAAKISFQLGVVSVNANEFKKVAQAINDGKIHVHVESAGPNLSAAYSPSPISKMTLSSNTIRTDLDRSGIVHESVHAVVDLTGHKAIGGRMDEAAGYLTECIYLNHRKYALNRIGTIPAAKKVYELGYGLVKTHKLLTKTNVKLTAKDVEELMAAIILIPGYEGL